MRVGAVLIALACLCAPAHAWGPAGHRWASGVAIELLPAEIPAFLRTPAARAAIGEIAPELDRSRGAGRTHDSERDAAHFIDLTDDGKVMGVLALADLPATRADYDAALNAGGTDQYKAGYLPYAIIDGYQQLAKDFALWRVSDIAARNAVSAQDRAWFAADRGLREQLLIRDLGIWSHYLGDASQPLHVSVHSEIWGNYPNPNGFFVRRGFHIRFEDDFVRDNVSRAAILATTPHFRDCACSTMKRVNAFLMDSLALVTPLFTLETRGAFPSPALNKTDPVMREGAAFATKRLAASAAEIRDLVVLAWRESAKSNVGYPAIAVADIESGKIVLTRQMMGGE